MNDQNNSQEILNLIQNIQSKLNMENNSTEQQNQQETNENISNNTYQDNQNITDNIPNNQNSNQNTNNFDIGSLLSMFMQNNKNSSQNSNQSFDPTIFTKFQRIFSNINADNPKKNLLLSLKPFLRKNRQDKISEYITMLTIADAIGIFNRKGSDNDV